VRSCPSCGRNDLLALGRGNVTIGTSAFRATARYIIGTANTIVTPVKVSVGTHAAIHRGGAISHHSRCGVAPGRAIRIAVPLGTERGTVAATAAVVAPVIESIWTEVRQLISVVLVGDGAGLAGGGGGGALHRGVP
jgi:hypothetical protein